MPCSSAWRGSAGAAAEVLAVAAVAGRRFDFALLHALLPLDEQALLQVSKSW